MRLDLSVVLNQAPELAMAAVMTLWLWLASLACGGLLGFTVALLRHYGGAPIRRLLAVPVDLIRGTPFLVQLFLLYYGGPFVNISLDPVTAGLLALSVYGAAYFSEIFRAGLQAVPRGHVEAAECLGMRRPYIVWRIMLPEMALLVFPASVNLAVVILKETAVLSIVTVPELTLQVSAIGQQHYAFAESMLLLAIFYWAMTTLFGFLGRLAEMRLTRFMTVRTRGVGRNRIRTS